MLQLGFDLNELSQLFLSNGEINITRQELNNEILLLFYISAGSLASKASLPQKLPDPMVIRRRMSQMVWENERRLAETEQVRSPVPIHKVV